MCDLHNKHQIWCDYACSGHANYLCQTRFNRIYDTLNDVGYKEKLLANETELLNIVLIAQILDETHEATREWVDKMCEKPGPYGPEKFVRKAIIGDWENHFDDNERKLVKHLFDEKIAATGLDKLWNK